VKVGVHMASLLPAALAKADLALTAQDQDGEPAVCVNTHLVKESLSSGLDIDCSTAACPDQCTCSLDKCALKSMLALLLTIVPNHNLALWHAHATTTHAC